MFCVGKLFLIHNKRLKYDCQAILNDMTIEISFTFIIIDYALDTAKYNFG